MPIISKLSDDGTSVDIAVPATTLNAEQVEALIAQIGAIRTQMIPEVPQTPQGKPSHHHVLTKYFFGIDPFARTPALSLRSPAFGWITFAIPATEIERIAR